MNSDLKATTILGGIFFICFLVLSPLGLFNDFIPKTWHTGYYSVVQIDEGDDAGYYAYLRSAFFDKDLDFINEHKYSHIENFNQTGYVFNNWQIGQSIFFIPFFLLGHLCAILLNEFGYSFSIDGYSTPYYMATAIAAQSYIFFGLLILHKILTKYFSQTSALTTTLGVWLGSHLIYYSFIRQRMAHGTEFCFSMIFMFVWLRYRKSRNKYSHALIGLIFGLLCLIRIINIIYFAIYITDQIAQWLNEDKKKYFYKQHLIEIMFFVSCFALAFSPQLWVWNQLNGSLFLYLNKVLNIMSGQSNTVTSVALLGNKIFKLLFGQKWSLVFSTPILFIGTIGIFFIRKSAKELLPGMIVFLMLVFIIQFSFIDSESYGNRYLLPAIGVISFGVAGGLDRIKKNRIGFQIGIILIILFIVLQYFILIQYKISLPYNDPRLTFKALSAIPSLLSENAHLLSRSTNFFRVLLFSETELSAKENLLFLVFYPLVQLIIVVIICAIFLKINKNIKEIKNNVKISNLAILFSIILCLFFLVKITPAKTEKEIKARIQYMKIIAEGDSRARNGELKEALRLFKNASIILPNHMGSYLRIGHTYDAFGEFSKANFHYKKAFELNPYNAHSIRSLGINSFLLGNFKKSEYYLKISIQPNIQFDLKKTISYHYLAILFSNQKRINEAIKMFEISLALNPNYKEAHLNFAVLLGLLNQSDKAILHFKEALRLGVKKEIIQDLLSQLQISLNI